MEIKNEAELLNIFCNKSYSNPLRSYPFFNTNYNEVWSTDGYTLIRVNPEILVAEYIKESLPMPKLEYPCEKTITIEALNKALEACPLVDEEVVIQDAVKCEECDGSGEVYWEYKDNHLHTHERIFDCPICDGPGEMEHEKTKKTGKKVIANDAVIEVGNAYIFAKYLQTLKQAMDFLNIASVKMVHNSPKGANEFVVNNDIRIIIASMLFDYSNECNAELELR